MHRRWKCMSRTFFRNSCGKQYYEDTRLPAVLTETDPRGELAEGHSVGVIAMGVEQFEADVDEGLQHGRPGSGAWLSPFCLPDGSVHVERGQRLLPVHRLHGRGEGRQSVWQKYSFASSRIARNRRINPGAQASKQTSAALTKSCWRANSKPFVNQKSTVYIHSWIINERLRGAARSGKENDVVGILITPKLSF